MTSLFVITVSKWSIMYIYNTHTQHRTCTLDGVALESVNGVPLRCNEYLVNRTRSYCGMLNASTCDAFPDSTGATCCNASFTDSRNNATIFSEDVCFEANPDLIDKFNGTRYLPDGVNWDIAMPVCKVGIPGITASSLIVGESVLGCRHTRACMHVLVRFEACPSA